MASTRQARVSAPGGEVAPKDVCRVRAGFGRKRAPEKIYAPAPVTRRITGISGELRRAEVPRSAPPSRERPVVELRIEGPDVKVLHAVALVHVVQGSALTQRPAQEAARRSGWSFADFAGTTPPWRRPARRVEAGQLRRSAPATDPDLRARSHTGTTGADPHDAAASSMRHP